MKLNTKLCLLLLFLFPPLCYAIELGEHKGVVFDLTLQLNRALMQVDNGTDSEVFFVDNDNSSSRLSLKAQGKINNNLDAGGEFEVEYQSNPSNDVSFDNRSVAADLNERRLDVWVESDTWGRVSTGQGSGAADGIMEIDLSGTSVVNWANPALLGGDIRFGDNGPRISQTMSNLDFEGRYDRIRYDMPRLGLVEFAVSRGVKEASDIKEAALRIDHRRKSGFRFKTELGYSVEETGDAVEGDEVTTGLSFEMRLDSGLTFGLAIAESADDDSSNPDSTYQAAKLGYQADEHAVSVLFVRVEDRHRDGDVSDSTGLGYVYSPQNWVDMYLGYKLHSLERPGEDYDDIEIVTSGIKVKF